MVESYNREVERIRERENLKRELAKKSDKIRQMVKSAGWKHLKSFMEDRIDVYKKELFDLSLSAVNSEDLKQISDIAITIDVYQSIIDKTNEFIKIGE